MVKILVSPKFKFHKAGLINPYFLNIMKNFYIFLFQIFVFPLFKTRSIYQIIGNN